MEIFIGLANAVIVAIVSYMATKIKKREERHKLDEEKRDKEYNALKDGIRAVLSDRLIQSCNYFNSVSGITTQQMQNITVLYDSYYALNGDGMITSLYHKTMALPVITDEEFRRRKGVDNQ